MYNTHSYNPFLGLASILPLIAIIVIFDLVVKGMALWRASKNSQKGWFIVLLIVNSIGILPIIYLIFFSKKNKKS
ncbi:hypothetical protein BH10PAT1_BH10PAT1_7930 [soil metagenome]